MMDLIQKVTLGRAKHYVKTEFNPGDTIEVSVVVKEGEKERLQAFAGTCIRIQGRGQSKTFTVRKMSDGIGVERTFPFASPTVSKVKLVASGRVRRSRLFYLRGLRGKAARIDFELAATPNKGQKAATAAAESKAAETAEKV
jgi:large subunit ribosomal protein L19